MNKSCLGPFQRLVQALQDSAKRFVETRGYCCDVGLDGWPLIPTIRPIGRGEDLRRPLAFYVPLAYLQAMLLRLRPSGLRGDLRSAGPASAVTNSARRLRA